MSRWQKLIVIGLLMILIGKIGQLVTLQRVTASFVADYDSLGTEADWAIKYSADGRFFKLVHKSGYESGPYEFTHGSPQQRLAEEARIFREIAADKRINKTNQWK